jgi:hypothetical protein
MADDEDYVCKKCGRQVSQAAQGTRNRNHCPFCLWSLHVAKTRNQDDRDSRCHGLMEPIAISTQRDGEWSIVHRCQTCGDIKTNRIAGDDDTLQLLCLALRPLVNVPFPLDQVPLEAMARYSNPRR